MLTKFLLAVVAFILAFVVLDATNEIENDGLIALAVGLVVFIFAPVSLRRI